MKFTEADKALADGTSPGAVTLRGADQSLPATPTEKTALEDRKRMKCLLEGYGVVTIARPAENGNPHQSVTSLFGIDAGSHGCRCV
jgi:hypothetical protein